MRLSRSFLTIVFFLLGGVWAAAQVTTGTISGTITDPSGAVLPNVKVEVTNEGTGVSRTLITDASGRYSAPLLSVGNYKVSGSIEGFQTEVRTGIVLTVGGTSMVDMRLQVGAVTQTVEVSGEAPLVQTTESSVSYVVTGGQLGELPINGRDMSQLILIAPGVNVSNTPGGQAFNGYGKRISIAGMRGEDNTYLMDGGLIGDFRRHIPAGPSGAMLGLETVQEFQVITNSVGAQYGRVLGGVFNAVSKSGTNEIHGDAYDYLRNEKLDAAKWEDNRVSAPKPPFRRNQFGATLGGPLRTDKTFFFVAYESTREVLTSTQAPITLDDQWREGRRLGVVGTAPSQTVGLVQEVNVSNAMRPYINQYPLPSPEGRRFTRTIQVNGQNVTVPDGTAEYIFAYKQPSTEHFGQARIDFPSLSAKDSFFFRFTGSNSEGTSATNSPTAFPGFEQVSSLRSWLMTASYTRVISPEALNTVRVHFSRVIPLDIGNAPTPGAGILVTPGQADGPELTVSGISTFGGGGFATKPTRMTSNRFTYQDDVNWRIGKHGLQFGGFAERFQLNSLKPNRAWGVWTFTNVNNFLINNSTQFRGAIPGYGDYIRGLRNWMFAFYIQDDWRVSDRLTVNMGVRWEPYTVPTEVNNKIANLRSISDTAGTIGDPYWENKSKGDFGPRLGFAWSPFAGGKTSVRAGAGLLFAPNDPNLYYNQMDRMPPNGYDFTLAIPSPAFNRFPDAVAELVALDEDSRARTGLPLQSPAYVVPFQDSFDSRAIQWNFNAQQQVSADSVITLGYTGSRGTHLLSVGDYNQPRGVFNGVSLEAPSNANLVNTAWPSILLFANNTSSTYHAFIASYQKHFSAGLQTTVSYTWSKSLAGADSGQTGGGVTTGGGRQKYPYDNAAQWGLSGYDFRHVFSLSYTYDLPEWKGGKNWMNTILSGWRTSGNLSIRPGQPVNLSVGVPTVLPARGTGAVPGTGTSNTDLCCSLNQLSVTPRSPNAKADRKVKIFGAPNESSDPTGRELYFDPSDYAFPGNREWGNLGRNTMIGPGSITWSPAIFKNTKITERTTLEFRTEFFNILNRPNFGSPGATIYNATGAIQNTAGIISNTIGSARQVQFALKLLW